MSPARTAATPDDHAPVPPAFAAGTAPATAARSYKREIVVTISAVAVGALLVVSLLSSRATSSPAAAAATAAAPASSGAAAPAADPAPAQRWTTENSAYWVGNARKSKAFELPAENTVQVWMRSVRPTLLVRCMQGNLQVLVITESALKIEAQTSDHTVTYATDGGSTVTETWPDSEEHDALFARDAHGFVDRLLGARTLQVGYTPHNASPVTAAFHVLGLASLMEPFAQECGRKK